MNRQTDWCIIVPVSATDAAKTRLRPLGEMRTALARSLAHDVLAAVAASPAVGRILLVGDGSLLPAAAAEHRRTELVNVPVAELNAAITAAESHARALGYQRVAVVVADIACVRSRDIDALLSRARSITRGYVHDHRGGGTTVLTTTGPALGPKFGPGSAARHRSSGAVSLEASARVRLDIDDPADVTVAAAYGLGPATLATLAAAGRGSLHAT